MAKRKPCKLVQRDITYTHIVEENRSITHINKRKMSDTTNNCGSHGQAVRVIVLRPRPNYRGYFTHES